MASHEERGALAPDDTFSAQAEARTKARRERRRAEKRHSFTDAELKTHDAEVAAAALRDAADEVDGHGVIPSGITNDYWEGWTDAVEKIRDVLRARADESNPR